MNRTDHSTARGKGRKGGGRRPDGIRDAALEVLERWRAGEATLGACFETVFRRHPDLRPGGRGVVADGVHAVLRSLRLLDAAIDAGLSAERAPRRGPGHAKRSAKPSATPLGERERDLARWLARAVLDGRVRPASAARELPDIDWDVVASAPAALRAETDPTRRLAVLESLPDWFAARLIAERGEADAVRIARALNSPPRLAVRANRLRTSPKALARKLRDEGVETAPSTLAPDGLILVSPCNPYRLEAFRDGLFEVQDEGSQLVAELVAPPPGSCVVDTCAGAGGKTLHLAARLGGRGRVVALDVPPAGARRIEELRRRARRAGAHDVRAVVVPPEGPLPDEIERLAGTVKRVLVDAPCSGTGVWSRNPEARWRLEEAAVARLVETQQAILARFAPLVGPGGRLVYATCSLLRAENDDVVAAFLSRYAEFELVPAREVLGGERARRLGDGELLRVEPHRHGCDAFFAAVLRRRR